MRLLRSAGFLALVLIVHMVSGCGVGEDFNNARIRGENIFSMIAITNVAVALERYRGKHSEYPTADSMADLRPLLETYLGQERGIDRWGEELIVDVSPDGYVLSSRRVGLNSRIVVLSRLTGVTIPLEDRFEWGDAAGELACAETPWWPVDPSCPLRYPPRNLATSQ